MLNERNSRQSNHYQGHCDVDDLDHFPKVFVEQREHTWLQNRERNEHREEAPLAAALVSRDKNSCDPQEDHPNCVPRKVSRSLLVGRTREDDQQPTRAEREDDEPSEATDGDQRKRSANQRRTALTARVTKHDFGKENRRYTCGSPEDRTSESGNSCVLASSLGREKVLNHQD